VIQSLQCDVSRSWGYTSSTQIARVITEHWCAENLYCAACRAERLIQAAANTRAIDFRCPDCTETYQVKSQRLLNLSRLVDGAYGAMLTAVRQNTAPNLVIVNYRPDWLVQNVVLIPALFFTESVLERRAPLRETARRAGWVGCNLVLSNVPQDGKIRLVDDRTIVPSKIVRSRYQQFRQLENLDSKHRGWTLDVLRIARSLGRRDFTLADMYVHEVELAALHPENRNIRPKIRQQLQVLRSLGVIRFVDNRGRYELVK
jgi:type II restriction enzyme